MPADEEVGPIDLILDLAEEVPYNVRHLADQCWNQLRSEPGRGPTKLTRQTVKSALEFVVRSLDLL